jgi:hypothetical protein
VPVRYSSRCSSRFQRTALTLFLSEAPPECFSFFDGTCDEPAMCPSGSDFVDCGSSTVIVNASGSIDDWLSS